MKEPEDELFYYHIIGTVSGDGTAWGRMNACEGGWTAPKEWDEIADQLLDEGFTYKTPHAKIRRRAAAIRAAKQQG